MKTSLILLLLFQTHLLAQLIITGVLDGPRTGGKPKCIELYALEAIEELSIYGVGSVNNGKGVSKKEFTFPEGSLDRGEFIYVSYEAEEFAQFFGFAPEYTGGVASINGDDAIELFEGDSVIDVFGDIDRDGTGEAWEYRDGWVYRREHVTSPSDTFSMDEWELSGVGALDDESNNSLASNPFPLKSFHATLLQSGFTLSTTALVVSESSGSFSVVLDVQPKSDVVLDITSENSAKVTLSPQTLTFSQTTWNIPQTVTLNAVDANQVTQIIISVHATHSDDSFDDLRDKSVTVTSRESSVQPLFRPFVVEPIIEEQKETKVEEVEVVEEVEEQKESKIEEPNPIENIDTDSPLAMITKLYITTFGRAPEMRGSNYWLYKSKLNLEDIARSFFDQEETQQKYPQGFSDYDFIVSIYNHIYNRDPDQAGGDYWLQELESGKIERPLLILALIRGAKGEDALMLKKQTRVGIDFAKSGSVDLDLAKRVFDDIR